MFKKLNRSLERHMTGLHEFSYEVYTFIYTSIMPVRCTT